ncbi:MAG TPA: transglutaminase-like domain-containing protein [Steroidobacteraceae bacterium]
MHARWRLSRLAGAAAIAFTWTAAHADDRHWQRVMSGDRKVGSVEYSRRIADGHVFESERLTLELGKTGRRVTYQVTMDTESTADGALVHVVREARTREGHSRVEARVVNADLQVDIGAGKHRQTRRFPGAGAGLMTEEYSRGWRQAVGSGETREPLAFRIFDPSKAAVVELELSRLPAADGPVRIRRLLRASGRESATLQALDARGLVVEEALRLGGLRVTLVGATEGEAHAPDRPLDHVVAQFQKSPYRIPANGLRARIRYGFDNGGRAPQIPLGGGQRSWTDGQTTWIQVCAECAPDAATLEGAARSRALRATPWLNFEDEALTTRARNLARGVPDASTAMRRLTAYVRNHMSAERIDMLGYGSALEAFRSRRGDCTEYAVLLAAMGRAAGVPTRVVSGLVYSRSFEGQHYVFVPHVWVHAWTGSAWQAFDAALGRFDSTHLAFAASDEGSPAELFEGISLAHELRLTSAARVLPRKVASP